MVPSRTITTIAFLLLPFDYGCATLKRFGYEGFRREGWQHPGEVVRRLGLQRGQVVADVGAGGGYFTFRLADAVGPTGKVYAADVDPAMVDYLRRRAADGGYANVEAILAEEEDPRLAANAIDLIFSCNAYHHLRDRAAYFARVKQYLRADGRVAVIDHGNHGLFARLFGHATAAPVIRAEMRAAGYRLEAQHDVLPRQSFLVFTPTPA